jgi:DNA-binding GntR family transcriptional regulator
VARRGGLSALSDADELPAPVDPYDRRSSGEQAALYIRRLIFDGVLREGDRVPQDAVAERLGLSRIPVREALLSLEREGWVTIRPHRGAFIGALDESVVRDHYDLYGHLYSFAVARAAERRTPELLDRLARLQKEIREAQDPQTAWRLNRAFHGTVLDMARSPRIGAVVRSLAGIVPGNFFELVPGSMDVEKTGTAAILRALKRGDAERAAQAYARMMRRQGDLVVELFQTRGILPASSETMVAR